MSQFIEALEFRKMLSASPDQLTGDLQQTVTDGQSILGDVFSCRTQIIADGKSINADLRAAPHTAANRKLLAAFRSSQNQWVTTFTRDYHALIRAGLAEGRQAAKDGTTFVNNPTDAATASRLLAELITLQQRTASPLATFLADMPKVTSALSVRLAATAASNPGTASLQAHATGETTDVNTCPTTFQTDAKTAQTDVATLIADLAP